MKFVYNDGGRADAGYKGAASDCACRAAAIAAQRPYKEVYELINEYAKKERTGKRKRGKSNARTGVYQSTFIKVMAHYGFKWVATMHIGQGCTTHLRSDELPPGRIVVNVSKHYAAVIDGVLNDTHDCTRDGERCVYGYFIKESKTDATEENDEAIKKTAFVRDYLSPLLRAAGLNINNAKYRKHPDSNEEIVTVTYESGFARDICVSADSYIAIVADVLGAL